MIIEFSVQNFRSIKDEQTLSFVATSDDAHIENVSDLEATHSLRVLKTAIIYGANASGKSNILKAMQEMKKFVLNSTKLNPGDSIPSYDPFRLDVNCKSKESKFQIEFISTDDLRYKYTIIFTSVEIVFEELTFFPKGQEALLYVREKGKETKFGDYLKGRKQSIAKELLENHLFLSRAANSNHPLLKELYLFFKDKIKFHSRENSSSMIGALFTTNLLASTGDGKVKKIVESFLLAADTGIQAVEIKKSKIDSSNLEIPKDIPDSLRKLIINDLTFKPIAEHYLFDGEKNVGRESFDFSEESDGTIKMYDLAGKIIHAMMEGAMLVVDELDSSLHPFISAFIFKVFQGMKNKGNAQMLVSTHDTSLLSPDNFRRDQVWFTEKRKFGDTKVYSLVEFDKNLVRKNTQFGSWYLSGRFGGLPLVNKNLFECC